MKVSKILSKSDTGESGSNQSGVLVPKDKAILKFFPTLVEEKKNPRQTIVFSGPENDKWSFNFIHYNNLKYGGTRNEYRLTCIRGFLKNTIYIIEIFYFYNMINKMDIPSIMKLIVMQELGKKSS